jgi:hypothetical protein
MKKRKTYQYTITLTKPMWPRKLVDALMRGELSDVLVAVKDLQNDSHMYGDTYAIEKDNTSTVKKS